MTNDLAEQARELARSMRLFITVDITDVLRPQIIFNDEAATSACLAALQAERDRGEAEKQRIIGEVQKIKAAFEELQKIWHSE